MCVQPADLAASFHLLFLVATKCCSNLLTSGLEEAKELDRKMVAGCKSAAS